MASIGKLLAHLLLCTTTSPSRYNEHAAAVEAVYRSAGGDHGGGDGNLEVDAAVAAHGGAGDWECSVARPCPTSSGGFEMGSTRRCALLFAVVSSRCHCIFTKDDLARSKGHLLGDVSY